MVVSEKQVHRGAEGARRLIVLVHGWWDQLPMFSTADVAATIIEEFPDADVLRPQYSSHLAANTDPEDVAGELAEAIEDACNAREQQGTPYDEIVLVGYSLGSLIVRKTYIIGRTGRIAEAGFRRAYKWPEKVERIVLLAGVNSGWSLAPKPERLSWLLYILYRLVYPWSAVLSAGKLIRAFRRGTPFVENLRIEWHWLHREGKVPPVIQLTGMKEDVVTLADIVDIKFCRDFIFLDVPETGHMNAANFHQKSIGPLRRRLFVDAMTTPIAMLRPKSILAADTDLMDPAVRDVVFVVHGIRDFGHWTLHVREAITRIAHQHGRDAVPYSPAYERFPMLEFLFTRKRTAKVRWFIDQYTQVTAQYPNARIHFIGHSNGTYLLAKSLELYSACRFENVVLTGSVVRRDYPWNRMVERKNVARIRNDMAANDWVVAVFPRFFEQVREVLGVPANDIGSGGVFGFTDMEGKRFEVLVEGGHSSAIDSSNHESLVRFALEADDGSELTPGIPKAQRVAASTQILSSFCWLIWLVLMSLPMITILGIAAAWYRWQESPPQFQLALFSEWIVQHPFPCLPLLVPSAGVALGVWWLLKTI